MGDPFRWPPCSIIRRLWTGTVCRTGSSPGGSATSTITPGTLTLTDARTGAMGTCATSTVTGTIEQPISFASYNPHLDLVRGMISGIKVTLAASYEVRPVQTITSP